MSEQQKGNENVGGQPTESDLPVFEGISPEIVAQLKAEDPAAFQAGQSLGLEGNEPASAGSGDGTDTGDGGGGRPGQAEKSVPLTALHEERTKRKELQDRLDRIQRERDELARLQVEVLKRMQAQPQVLQAPQAPPADPLEELIERKLSQKLKPVEEKIHASDALRETEARIAAAEASARQKYADYDEVVQPVMAWMGEQAKAAQMGDQRAHQAMGFILGQPNPAEAAYTMGVRFKYEQMMRQQQDRSSPGPGSIPGAAGGQPADISNLSTEQMAAAAKAQAAAAFPRGTEVPGGGGGSKGLSEADLSRMSSDEWLKLPAETRKKLLFGGGV